MLLGKIGFSSRQNAKLAGTELELYTDEHNEWCEWKLISTLTLTLTLSRTFRDTDANEQMDAFDLCGMTTNKSQINRCSKLGEIFSAINGRYDDVSVQHV